MTKFVFTPRPKPASAFTDPESRELPEGWPTAYTSDGVLIVPGLRVRDYDYRDTVVTSRKPIMDGGEWDEENDCLKAGTGTPWFACANGKDFDGSRLQAIR
jgi:hypothetical protein